MIVEYLRPKTLEEALKLLDREQPKTIPLAGGNVVTKLTEQNIAVVDLQNLGLNGLSRSNDHFIFGAMASLSDIESFTKSDAFSEAIQIQAGKNLRNGGTIAGLICAGHGRSPLLTLLLAMDAKLVWEPGNKEITLGNWLPLRNAWTEGKLIREIVIPDVKIKFSSIARSPKDKPVLCCAIAVWPSKRMRMAVGGFGTAPKLVLDGTTSDDVSAAMGIALADANDQWASAEYRVEAGMKLGARLYKELLSVE